jgi:hypothetical protein
MLDTTHNRNDDWTPASNGTEPVFTTRLGVRVQYVWQPSTGAHAYLNLDTDMIMSDAQASAAGL